jgi:hypothetical protein
MEQGFEIFDFYHLKLPVGGMATVAFCKEPKRLAQFKERVYGTQDYGIREGILASVAFCNPKDNFSRKKGRIEAVKRLVTSRSSAYGVWVESGTVRDMATQVIVDLCANRAIPTWFKEALEKQREELEKGERSRKSFG